MVTCELYSEYHKFLRFVPINRISSEATWPTSHSEHFIYGRVQNPAEQRELGAEANLSAILWQELAAAAGRAKEDLTAGFHRLSPAELLHLLQTSPDIFALVSYSGVKNNE